MSFGDPAELLDRRNQQAVVGSDMQAALTVPQGERSTRAADAGIDDGEVDSFGHEGQRVRESQRSLQNRLRRDAVRDVDDLDLGRDLLHDAVAGTDEVVGLSVVGEERDGRRHGPAPRLLTAHRVGHHGVQHPVDVMARGLDVGLEAVLA